MLTLDLSKLSAELRQALSELLPDIGMAAGDGITVLAQDGADGLYVSVENNVATIRYQHKWQFFRGVSHLKKVIRTGQALEEHPTFQWLSYMADMSRNGVMNMDTLKKTVRWLAAMGYNDLMLYMEDVYEVPEYPYFGYQRGRYTKEELKEIVAYGEGFGITLTPCIQSLGHLRMPLVWRAFRDIKDSDDVLYVGEDKTYDFLEACFRVVCECFKTRRVNIGMDEAHTLGLGRRLEKEGYAPKAQLMTHHLQRVGKLCEKYGLQPLIWSDMFFRPHTPGDGYYSTDVEVPQEVIDGIPANYTIVYWDYYNSDLKGKAEFDHTFGQHLRFKNPIAFAGGSWKWLGFAPNNAASLGISDYHTNACVRDDIKDVTVTAWGDDGAEASVFSALPAMVLYAEKLNRKLAVKTDISDVFEDLFGMALADYMLLDLPNMVPDSEPMELHAGFNPCKWLLYSDPLCGRMDFYIHPSYKAFYAQAEATLAKYTDNPNFGYMFESLSALCGVLKGKATLSLELREAYLAGNREKLAQIIATIPGVIADLDRFIDVYRAQWYKENRLFGFEALEMRFGALRARLIGVEKTVQLYLDGKLDAIAPLAEPVLDPRGKTGTEVRPEHNTVSVSIYGQVVPVTYLQD